MTRKLKKTDLLFVLALTLGLLIHIYFVFAAPFFDDESFYASIPYRLVNGDSLIQHEWHLSQFSSLFSFLPVYIWTAIKGSAEGIFIFLRCTYLALHTVIAVIIYAFFRKHEKWAVMASMIFYTQVSYRTLAMSYQSMFVVFLLLLSLCLISIYQKNSVHFYIFAGVCFGCCCVCNPLFCVVFVLYLLSCALWTKRQVLENYIIKIKNFDTSKKGKKLTKKQKRQQEQQRMDAFPNMENYNCFFTKEAILRFSCGVLIAGVIAVVFYFLTGGTFESVIDNIENLLGSSEYDVASLSLFSKLEETAVYFTRANIGMPWILPAIFIVLLLDKNRRNNKHRLAYLLASILWTIIFVIGTMVIYKEMDMYAVSLPFFVMSTICYLLTENKNKVLFHCMYIPCLIATFFQYLAANTHLAVIGVVLAVNNIAGVIFAKDFWQEVRLVSTEDSEKATDKSHSSLCRSMIIVGLCVQIMIYGAFYMQGRIYTKDDVKVTSGPYAGVYMPEEYNEYNRQISDMDVIRERSEKDDPVYLASYNNWMYMYLERPIAVYTTWYRGSLDREQLIRYYRENPKKIPEYIYIESLDPNCGRLKIASEMFEFTKEELSKGVLLTIEGCKF